MPGFHTGPISWRLDGDRDQCAALEGRARTCVQWLFEQIEHNGASKPWGLRQHVWTWTDGSAIRAIVFLDLRGRKSAWCEISTESSVKEVTVIAEMSMFHGWLGGLRSPLWLPTVVSDPPRVWVTADLFAYLTGAGTVLPESVGTEHIFGTIVTTGDVAHWPAKDPSVDNKQAGNPPALVDGSYPWYLSTVAPDDAASVHPTYFTGIARLRAQAMRGMNLMPPSGLPSGWDAPAEVGIIRSPIGSGLSWWVVRCTAGGAYASRLVIPDKYSNLVRWLSDGLVTDDADQQRIESYVLALATAEVDDNKTPVIIELDNAAGIAEVYSGSDRFCWGWDFQSQAIGSSTQDTSSAITVMGGVQGSYATWTVATWIARLAFSW